ncbi:MAG TPA: glycoside hydrolase family 3 N-terminal domain-containing protein [Mycobacterium sp.]|nr:glycoside hydrolase family 3 N-terminal domain-containing protein [Mycobacterium sp.]
MLKHFPGARRCQPQHRLPHRVHPASVQAAQTVALPPFVAGIRAGAPAIMVSNAIVPGLTRLPASLAPAAIRRELVGTLHFGGLILTDSLSAGAIAQAGFHLPRAAVQAIRAGADMIMYNAATAAGTLRRFDHIVSAEMSAVTAGTLARSRLVAAARAALAARHVAACR